MAGTIVESNVARGRVGCVTLTCVADVADGSFPQYALGTKISGFIVALETDPGTPAPQTLYDLVLNDQNGFDVLQTIGANRSATAAEKPPALMTGTQRHPPVSKGDTLTLVITNNNVNSAQIIVKIYYEGDGR